MLSVQNVNRPKGQISDNPTTTANLATNDQLLKADYYKPLVVGYHNGAEVQLSDIADVQDSVEDIRAGGLMNGKIAVLVIVSRQPGANIIDTVDRIKAALPQLKASLPVGLTITIVLDQTTTIRASVHDVEDQPAHLHRARDPGRFCVSAKSARYVHSRYRGTGFARSERSG